MYNPVSRTFTSLGNVVSAKRNNYAPAKLPDGTFLLAGGDTGPGTPILKSADIFNPVTDSFAPTTHNMTNAYFDFAQA
jgi:hypothetical protein